MNNPDDDMLPIPEFELTQQQALPVFYQKETDIVTGMKLALIANPEPKGDRLSFTFKLDRVRHAKLLAAATKHGMTVTDLLRLHVDRLLPVLQKAAPVDVPSYKPDGRTNPKRRHVHVYRPEQGRDGRKETI